jgi:hypothetical protein
MDGFQRHPTIVDKTRRSIHAWQARIRDPSLTVLLVLELCAIFLATPLAAKGLPTARVFADTLVLGVLIVVVMLTPRLGPVIMNLAGLAAIAASLLDWKWSPATATLLRRGGDILAFSALIWVVAHAVFAPGRVTLHRLRAAAVIYLSLAMVFASAYALIWELSPDAFAHVLARGPGLEEFATMLYFSLTTLTTTGYGDIVAVDPLARSLANLESVLGQFYMAITVARLVTLELQDRHRRA